MEINNTENPSSQFSLSTSLQVNKVINIYIYMEISSINIISHLLTLLTVFFGLQIIHMWTKSLWNQSTMQHANIQQITIDNKWPLVMFLKGTTTNGHVIVSFKIGALSPSPHVHSMIV
jgi:hypothetical protein